LSLNTIIVVGIAAMLLLAIGIIIFVILYQRRVISHQLELKKINEQKELELIQASIQSEEGERNRIASELHDDVVATLASARLFLYKGADVSFETEKINQAKDLLDESIGKIRGISHKLQPALLQHIGLQLSLQSLIETIDRSGSIKAVHYIMSTIPRTGDHIELSAYRIAQELITNIVKHAQASSISIRSGMEQDNIVIIFNHDGVGITNELYRELIYKKGSTGLKNIVNRLKSVNGKIDFHITDNQLYRTELSIPVSG